jgi:hypothetical protein
MPSPLYSSADHGSIFKGLLGFVHGAMRVPSTDFQGPYFDITIAEDQVVQACLDDEYRQLSLLNLEISLRNDYWRLFYDVNNDSFCLSLAPPQRRSALVLIDHKAEFLDAAPQLRRILSRGSSAGKNRAIPLVLATGMREAAFLADAVPDEWSELLARIGFTVHEAVRFQAFVQALINSGILWFRAADLLEMFTDFAKGRRAALIAEDQFHRLIDFFSVPPETAAEWGIPVPFVGFGDWLAYWPFAHHVLPPSLTFLTLIIRKHSDTWDGTVGANLARVAVALRDQLPNTPGLLFATMKKKNCFGDVDLAIYQTLSRVLLLCEIRRSSTVSAPIISSQTSPISGSTLTKHRGNSP